MFQGVLKCKTVDKHRFLQKHLTSMHRCSWLLHEKEESVYVHFANFHFWIPLRSMALCQVRNIQSFIVPSCAGPLQPADWVFLPIVDLYNLAISVWVNIKVRSCVILNLHFCRLGAAVYLISFSCMNRIIVNHLNVICIW